MPAHERCGARARILNCISPRHLPEYLESRTQKKNVLSIFRKNWSRANPKSKEHFSLVSAESARRWRGFHWLVIFDKVGSSEVVKTLKNRALSSVVERYIDIVKAEGSIPSGRTKQDVKFLEVGGEHTIALASKNRKVQFGALCLKMREPSLNEKSAAFLKIVLSKSLENTNNATPPRRPAERGGHASTKFSSTVSFFARAHFLFSIKEEENFVEVFCPIGQRRKRLHYISESLFVLCEI